MLYLRIGLTEAFPLMYNKNIRNPFLFLSAAP